MSDAEPVCEFDADNLVVELDLTLPGDPKRIPAVVTGIMRVLGNTECGRGQEAEIELALTEALANAVMHGCRNDPHREVGVCVACDAERGLLIVVRDPGQGFDPAQLPCPVRAQSLYDSHGRGIFLINQLMDDVRFERGGTEIHMRKFKS